MEAITRNNYLQMAGKIAGIDRIIRDNVRAAFKLTSIYAQDYIRNERLTGGTSDNKLAVRTGRLRSSVIPLAVTSTDNKIKAGVSIGTRYAHAHIRKRSEGDLIIRPKNKKYLAIPLIKSKTPFSPLSGRYTQTYIAESKKGNLIIFGRKRYIKGKRAGQAMGNIMPLFLLRDKVKIPTRIYSEEVIDKMENDIIPRLEDIMSKTDFKGGST